MSLEPFVLECGHYPDVDFRGAKQVGDKLACIGCYKGEPAEVAPDFLAAVLRSRAKAASELLSLGVFTTQEDAARGAEQVILIERHGRPETEVSPETKALLERTKITDAAECLKNARMDQRFAEEPMPTITHSPVADSTIALASIPHALDDQRPRLAQATTESSQALAIAREALVRSPEALEWAGGATKHAKDWIDYLDAEREKLTKPLLAEKNKVDDVFMPAIKNWRAVEADLKSKIGQYHAVQRAEQERVMRESAHVYQQGGTPIAPVPVVVSTEGVGVRETWDFEITNPILVPRELCSPDPAKIESRRKVEMATSNEPPSIPGVRFFKTQQVRVTRR